MSKSTPSRRSDSAARRGMILDEAMRTISEKGFFGFRIQDLAQRCGLTNGGLLYHFASKEELLLAVLEERENREQVAIRETTKTASLHQDGSRLTLDDVMSVFRAIVVRGAQQVELVRLFHVLNAEALHQGHPAHTYFTDREKRVLSTFSEMVRPFTTNPDSLARRILALAGGLEIQWLRSECGFDLADEWDRTLAALFAGARDEGNQKCRP